MTEVPSVPMKPASAANPARLRSAAAGPVPMLDFARQFAALRDEVMAAIEQVCASQRFILGPEVAAFEAAAAQACGAAFGVGCASGTDALWLALAAANIGGGDLPAAQASRVITSPFSFFASASSLVRAGARPVFADIDPRTFNLSPAAVGHALEQDSAVAVMPVHLYGQCADWDGFRALAERHPGLILMEDAAQAFGAEWNGVPAGALGEAAAFSFYPTKNLAAFGDAGLLTTRSAELAERARMLRAHGMRQRYFHEEMGWNSRLDTLQAAVLTVKLKYLPTWNQRRRELAAGYDALFREAGLESASGLVDDGLVLPWTDPRATHVFHQYVIRAPRRNDLRARLTARQIGSEIYYPLPIHLQKAMAHLGYKRGDFPEAERAADEVLALPIYPELREDEQQVVVATIAAFYR